MLPRSSSALPSPAKIRKCLNRRRRDASKAGTTRIDPAPTVRPSGAYQTLELCGELEFNVAGMDVKKMEKSGMLDLSANRMFIGAWLVCLPSTCDTRATHRFYLSTICLLALLPVD